LRRAGLVLAAVLLSGCALRSSKWRLTDAVLVPPGVSNAAVNHASFLFSAGVHAPGSCATSAHGVTVHSRGAKLRITVQRDQLAAAPPGWLSTWTAALSARGCVDVDDSLLLAERIAESVPMDPGVARDLLHPNPAVNGWRDLVRGGHLRVVGPVLREGAAPGASAIAEDSGHVTEVNGALTLELKASPDFVGYETDEYQIGRRVVAMSASVHVDGKETSLAAPRANYFQFSAQAAFFREFFLTRVSDADHDIAVLAAPTLAELDARTHEFIADPTLCRRIDCVLIPKEVAVTPMLVVSVNGKNVAVAIDSSIAGAMEAAGQAAPESVLPTLSIKRPHAGRLIPVVFDRSAGAILSLPLKGGEEIRWSTRK